MKDSVREQWLTKNQWQFEYQEKVALSAINITESVRRQIRMEDKVDQAHVARLGLAIKDGASLPALLLVNVGGKLELADGIHRYAAYESTGAKNLDAYIVTNADTPAALELLRRTANAPAVKGFSTEEAVRQAVALVQRHGWKPTEAARAMQVAENSVTTRIRTAGIAERLSRLAPKADYKFAVNTLDSLGRIQRDDLMIEAARITHQYRLAEQNARPIFTEATKIVTDADAEQLLKTWSEKYPVRRGPTVSTAPEVRVHTLEARFRAALAYYDTQRIKTPQTEALFRWMASECLIRAAGGTGTVSGDSKSTRTTRRGSVSVSNSGTRRADRAAGSGAAKV